MDKRQRILALIESLDGLVMSADDAHGALANREIQARVLEIEEEAIAMIYQLAEVHKVDMSRELGWGFASKTAKTASRQTRRALPGRGVLTTAAGR